MDVLVYETRKLEVEGGSRDNEYVGILFGCAASFYFY